jgi:hypothetical protein
MPKKILKLVIGACPGDLMDELEEALWISD